MRSVSSVSILSEVEVLPGVVTTLFVEVDVSRCHLPVIPGFSKRIPLRSSLG